VYAAPAPDPAPVYAAPDLVEAFAPVGEAPSQSSAVEAAAAAARHQAHRGRHRYLQQNNTIEGG